MCSIVILTILIFPAQEHGISLHLFESSLICFISDLKFSAYKSLVPVVIVQLLSCVQFFVTRGLGRLIRRYLILSVALMDGIISLISLSDFSLLVYRNASEFCVLTLFSMTLLNLLISSSNFLIVLFVCLFWRGRGGSMYSILSSANRESFTSYFPI